MLVDRILADVCKPFDKKTPSVKDILRKAREGFDSSDFFRACTDKYGITWERREVNGRGSMNYELGVVVEGEFKSAGYAYV